MSGRIEKGYNEISKSKKSCERAVLASLIDESGVDADMPCTYCFKNNKACRMNGDSSRCSECVRRGRSCDGVLVASSRYVLSSMLSGIRLTLAPVGRLMESRKKLLSDEEDAQEALFVLQQQLSTAVNRLSRIRRIRKRVEERSKELVQRGMQELDEEDGVSRSLESEDRFIVQHLQDLGAPGDADWATFGLGDALLDPSLLAGPGSGGETLQASAGSASNA
jgi:hypothetical protein